MKRRRKVCIDYSLKAVRAFRKRAYRAQNGLCYWCKQPMTCTDSKDPHFCTAEHLVPLHEGGKTHPSNIVAACRKCNNERHPYLNRPPHHNKGFYTAGDNTVESPFSKIEKHWLAKALSQAI